MKKVYMLSVLKDDTVPEPIIDFLFDEEYFFFSKEYWVLRAKRLTENVNSLFNTNYNYVDLFGNVGDDFMVLCPDCKVIYYLDDCCECE